MSRWALLVVGLGLAACAPGDARDGVVARLAGSATDPALAVAPRTFGTATRAASRVSGDARFEISLDAPARRLRFSLASRLPERCPSAIAFSVLARRGDTWSSLFEETPPAGPAAWHDREIDLAVAAPETTRFAFVTRSAWTSEAQARRCAPKVEAWWGGVAFLGPRAPITRAGRTSPPDGIVLISLDTLGARDLSGFAGAAGVSPNLDAWMADAHSFRRAISPYGHTRPSHASLLSALYPHRHGATPENLLARFPSLVPRLADAGYWTVGFTEGAYVSASFGFAEGFDTYDDGRRGTQTAAHTDAAGTFGRAAEWIQAHARGARFFLFIHTYEVHIPYQPRDPAARAVARALSPGVERFFTPDVQLRTTMQHSRGGAQLGQDEIAHLAALYAAEIHYLDRVVAGFLERLEALGLADDTLVVLTADHGDQFGEQGKVTHGESLHNRVHHVPLAFRWPGRIADGETADPVELLDVMPTILDLAGVEGPDGADGESLAPWLLGRPPQQPRPAFSELPTSRWECERLGLPFRCRLDRYAVQTGRFKLVRSAVPAEERLIDLEADPREEQDASAAHPEALARLRALLDPFAEQADRAWAAHGPGTRRPLDEEMQEQLRALGYAE